MIKRNRSQDLEIPKILQKAESQSPFLKDFHQKLIDLTYIKVQRNVKFHENFCISFRIALATILLFFVTDTRYKDRHFPQKMKTCSGYPDIPKCVNPSKPVNRKFI